MTNPRTSSSSSSSSDDTAKLTWTTLIDESVHTSDDVDIGDIDAVSRDFIVVKRGFVNIHYYYIPIGKVEGWDGHVLWLKVPEEYIKKIMREMCTLTHHAIILRIFLAILLSIRKLK